MYCRTCGNKMNDNAELCVKCGVRRNVGTDYCQVCGTKTSAEMTTCNACGARLMKSFSSNQMKKAAINTGKKTLAKVLLVLGIILLVIAAGQLLLGMFEDSFYRSMDLISGGGRTGVLGGLMTGFGLRLKKKK